MFDQLMNIIVGVGDMRIECRPDVTLITYGLGSCIGLTLYDPLIKVGGLLHFMLPDSKLDTKKANLNPFMFADTAIPYFLNEIYKFGAKKERLQVKVAGGSQIMDESGFFDIGKKNYLTLRRILRNHDLSIHGEDVGGKITRTLWLEINTGRVLIKSQEFGIKEI